MKTIPVPAANRGYGLTPKMIITLFDQVITNGRTDVVVFGSVPVSLLIRRRAVRLFALIRFHANSFRLKFEKTGEIIFRRSDGPITGK